MKGLVVKNTGSWYLVECENGETYQCKIKGKFRTMGIRTTNPVSVGDRVDISLNAENTAFITSIEPRRNYIIRRSTNLSKESHILASNIDQVMLVVTLINPVTSTTFIDRFLATAEAYSVPAVIVVNKCDLLSLDEDKEYLAAFTNLYESIGYKVIAISAQNGIGIESLGNILKDKTTLISGNSGVGKSTLINFIVPGANLKTGDVSASHHTGMHTTTFSEMFKLPQGGVVIDTP
ncbi:MAG: ribosome small subunit-dependent GTPase A, partial [Bacteroidaceae bacterium]|nr:ribosome small subunit-dependent GTPase A [Bacteroidaceae bacterium]